MLTPSSVSHIMTPWRDSIHQKDSIHEEHPSWSCCSWSLEPSAPPTSSRPPYSRLVLHVCEVNSPLSTLLPASISSLLYNTKAYRNLISCPKDLNPIMWRCSCVSVRCRNILCNNIFLSILNNKQSMPQQSSIMPCRWHKAQCHWNEWRIVSKWR